MCARKSVRHHHLHPPPPPARLSLELAPFSLQFARNARDVTLASTRTFHWNGKFSHTNSLQIKLLFYLNQGRAARGPEAWLWARDQVLGAGEVEIERKGRELGGLGEEHPPCWLRPI